MLFKYKVLNQAGTEEIGSIDANNVDIAINSLQRRGFIVESIELEGTGSFLDRISVMFQGVSLKELVMFSNQVSILFSSHVSVLRIFRLLAEGSVNPVLRRILNEISDDIQGGEPLSTAMGKHPEIFSSFYVNMIRSGEESGKLSEVFAYLASYMERNYALSSKVKNALVYPAFVVAVFISAIVLMLTVVVPKLSAILTDGGQEIPSYTRFVINLSDFVRGYGLYFLVFVAVSGIIFWKFGIPGGAKKISSIKLSLPIFGNLFRKVYTSRISDNLETMLTGGVPMLRAIEITADVVGDDAYNLVLFDVGEKVKAGSSLSDAFSGHTEIPPIMVQMIKVGEETGELSVILKTLATFYKREVDSTVDTLVGLIEPIMIVSLAVGVGFFLAAVLIPIYSITGSM